MNIITIGLSFITLLSKYLHQYSDDLNKHQLHRKKTQTPQRCDFRWQSGGSWGAKSHFHPVQPMWSHFWPVKHPLHLAALGNFIMCFLGKLIVCFITALHRLWWWIKFGTTFNFKLHPSLTKLNIAKWIDECNIKSLMSHTWWIIHLSQQP